jgi:Arc/MetJ family transcription regulator
MSEKKMIYYWQKGMAINMIKTTVHLDEDILSKATVIFKGKTKKDIISLALRELVERHEQKDLYELFNDDKILIADDYDYLKMRGGVLNDIS